uniref:Sperm-associated antigen 5 n=1 Tax=Pygocentrus nattereri TaxID=42514 RepID=A0AAR2INL0_PYGNA
MRPDRAPLRDVQNEEKQKTAGVKAALLGHKNPAREVENVSPFSGPKADGTFITSISSNRSEEGAVGNVTLKSFLCAGGEVEISEGSEMSDESILVRALMLEDGPQTLNNTTVTYPDSNEAVLSNREHVDHPYCTHPSDEPNITFKSFTCPGGEIEVADGLIMQDSIMLDDMPLEGPSQSFRDESEISEDHAKLLVSPCHHVDHPYCHYEVDSSASRGDDCICTSVENLDAVVSNAELDNLSSADTSMALSQLVEEPGDLTFRSLTFPGAEVEIENTHDMSVISMLMNNLTLDGYLQPFSCSFSEHDGENNAALTSNSEHADHLYCCVEDADVCGDGSTNPLVPDPIICESKAHSSSQLSSTGLLENEVGDSSKGLQGQDNINQQTLSDNEEKNVLAQNVESYSQAAVGMSAGNFRAECGDVGAQNMPAQHNDVDLEASVVQDSALGLSGIHSGSEILRAESVHECHTDAMPLHTQLWSALTLCDPSTPRNAALGRSVLQGHVEGNLESRLWPELPESPIPPPQLNSTTLPQALTPLHPRKPREARIKAAMMPNEKAPVVDFSTMSKGPLQQQLRQMAELLILASGKIAAPSTPAPVQHHTAEMATTPVQHRSAAVWTTPVLTAERSVNTSAQVELVKETEVSDACTSTDSLLWSVSPSSLQSLSRPELEQKLLSTLIMVEVLSQQLSSAKSHTGGTGPAPSELRDRLVQTEHTQLSQVQYRPTLLLSLFLQCSLKQIESIVNEDLEILCKQMSEVKALYGRCMGALKRMEEKCKACLQERDGMRRGMEEAVQEKETVLRVLEQLRAHHSAQVSDLQRSLGSQQELTTALTHTYPQLVELNRSYVESLSAASALLREKLDDDEHLSAELHKAHWLLQKTNPVLQKLQQRASAAVEQSQLFQTERDIAVEEKAQMEVELEQAHAGLQTAEQQIADLNTQITIMNSEMTVLREQLSEVEEERAQLQRKSTELSATVSSSLASYAFLEQALASETNKLQRSLHETQESIDRADGLQADLEVSQRRVEELEEVLAQRDTLLTELHEEAENQRLQLRRLTQIQAELSSAREMGDFLQAENELTREQLTESEGLLRSHLQGLRERNLECEDLRLTLQQLRVERSSLQEELDSTRDKARVMLLEQGEQLAQATLDVSLLQHRVRCLTSSTHAAATAKVCTHSPIQSTTLVELLASLGDSMSELQSAIEQLKQHKDSELNSLQSNIRGLQEALQVEFDRHRVEEAELRQQVGRLKAQAEKDTQVLQQKTQDEKALRKLCRELEENMEAAQKQRAENSELRREGAELRRALQQSQVEVQALRAELTQLSDQSTTSTKELDDRIRLLKEVEKLKAKLMEVEESRAKLLERAKRHQMVHAMNQSKLERELHLLDDMIETARKTLSTVPEVVKNCPELQKLVEFLG